MSARISRVRIPPSPQQSKEGWDEKFTRQKTQHEAGMNNTREPNAKIGRESLPLRHLFGWLIAITVQYY
jgi:hypothetical protein